LNHKDNNTNILNEKDDMIVKCADIESVEINRNNPIEVCMDNRVISLDANGKDHFKFDLFKKEEYKSQMTNIISIETNNVWKEIKDNQNLSEEDWNENIWTYIFRNLLFIELNTFEFISKNLKEYLD